MKFYAVSRSFRVGATLLSSLYAALGVDQLMTHHAGKSLIGFGAAVLQLQAVWSRYWEILPNGLLRSKGYGADIRYRVDEVRYAGPVRKPAASPAREKDLELELMGGRLKRYAQVAEPAAFLTELQRAAPSATIVHRAGSR